MIHDVAVVHISSVHPATDTRIFVKECTTLAEAGYDVTLIAVGPPPGPTAVDVITIPQRHSRIRRAILGTRDVARALRGREPRIVHFHDPELLPLGLWLSVRGFRVIYDAHEGLRDDVSAKPYLSPRAARFLAGVAGGVEAFVAKRLDRVVAATPIIAAQLPVPATVISNYPILDEWTCAESFDAYDARPACGSYVGGIIALRCRDEMVRAAELVAARRSEFVFKFAGSIDPGDVVPDGPGVEYLGVLDRSQVDHLFGECRFGVVLMQPLPNIVTGLPTKFFEYLAAGLPVIVSRSLRLLCEIVDTVQCGIVVDESDPAAIAAAMKTLLSEPRAAFEMGQRGRAAVLREYSWQTEGSKLIGLYDGLMGAAVERRQPNAEVRR